MPSPWQGSLSAELRSIGAIPKKAFWSQRPASFEKNAFAAVVTSLIENWAPVNRWLIVVGEGRVFRGGQGPKLEAQQDYKFLNLLLVKIEEIKTILQSVRVFWNDKYSLIP